jgi:HPt (histidine-containing phosphotransfer) domain-containing protein
MDFKFINTGYLELVSAGDHETIQEIIDIFREQAVEISAEMRACLSSKNYSALGKLAHKAKSSVAIIGMNDLAEMLRVLEAESKAGINEENYDSLVSRFERETGYATKELDQWIANRRGERVWN